MNGTTGGNEPRYFNQAETHAAQLQAINWLIGRCEDQFVRSWLVQERDLLEKIGYPIAVNGGPL